MKVQVQEIYQWLCSEHENPMIGTAHYITQQQVVIGAAHQQLPVNRSKIHEEVS